MQTYKIIGADQKEYGPVSVDQLRQWIAQGRANAQTRVRDEHETEWRALADMPEFAAELAAAAASPPPPPSMPGPAPGTAPKTSGMAITSLVLGILGFLSCGVLSLIGLVLGIMSMSKIRKSNGTLSGSGLALAGTILSGISVLMIPIMIAMLLPALAKAKSKAQGIVCVNNVKQLTLAAHIFANEHTNQLPPAATWCDALEPELGVSGSAFKCPVASASERSHYAFNARVAGMEIDKVSPDTVLIFEAAGGWNVSGGPELMQKPSRHGKMFVVGFADGSVRQLRESELESLRWEP